MQTTSVVNGLSVEEKAAAPATPWYCRAMVVAGLFILIGIVWDISWHTVIGRDTFWTPAHICIHLGGTLGGLVSGWLVLRTTFAGTAADKAATIGLWGFRGPLGAWVTIWGALAMLTSAPFDDWWHNAYGLDVEILSPPHSVLAAGMYFHVVGGLLLVLSAQNRAAAEDGRQGQWLFAVAAGILICLAALMVTEESLPNQQHTGRFYVISCGVYPFFLAAMGRASKLSWPLTAITAIYMGLICCAVWILPLFPAQPRLAPIYNPVKNMAPPVFPLLLIVPALGMDLVFRWIGRGRGWKRDLILAPLLATVFTVGFILTQWHFSTYLISPEARNWFFGGSGFFSFADSPNPGWHRFWDVEKYPLNAYPVLTAWLLAVVMSWIGLAVGNGMSQVRR